MTFYIRLAFTSGLALRMKGEPTLQNPNCRKQLTDTLNSRRVGGCRGRLEGVSIPYIVHRALSVSQTLLKP
jgi:hypothetical protein